METKNITLKVKSELYDRYRELCKQKGLIVSRQFEITMEEQLKGGRNHNDKESFKRITKYFRRED